MGVEEIEHVTIATKRVTWLENARKKIAEIVEDDRHKFISSMKGLQPSYHLVLSNRSVRVSSINSNCLRFNSYHNAFAVLLLIIHVVLHTYMRYLFVLSNQLFCSA